MKILRVDFAGFVGIHRVGLGGRRENNAEREEKKLQVKSCRSSAVADAAAAPSRFRRDWSPFTNGNQDWSLVGNGDSGL